MGGFWNLPRGEGPGAHRLLHREIPASDEGERMGGGALSEVKRLAEDLLKSFWRRSGGGKAIGLLRWRSGEESVLLISARKEREEISWRMGPARRDIPEVAIEWLDVTIDIKVRLTSERSRVSDLDPDWIRIQSGQWIRIRIPDPDPGGQKWPTTVEKNW